MNKFFIGFIAGGIVGVGITVAIVLTQPGFHHTVAPPANPVTLKQTMPTPDYWHEPAGVPPPPPGTFHDPDIQASLKDALKHSPWAAPTTPNPRGDRKP